MKNELFLCSLFDYYGELLTDKQQQYFKDYYFDNFTLSELSENYCISRNAIHKTLKEAEEKLKFYEDKLKLLEKKEKIKKIIKEDELDKIIDLI